MTQVRQDRLESASVLFERYHAQIYGFYVKLTGDPTLSQDLTQTVFERMIRYRNSFKEQMPFRAWIFQIARNAYKDTYRPRTGNPRGYPTGYPQINIEETAVQDPGQAEEITRSETMQNLHLALARLPEGDREILLLTRFQELKYAEVAQITGSTEGAVKVRAYRAIRQLRELFFRIDAG